MLSRTVKAVLTVAFWAAVPSSILWALFQKYHYGLTWSATVHGAIYYWPGVGLLAYLSGQVDLLTAIQKGELVNIRARGLDFIHWVLLICLNIGSWQAGTVSLSWFILKIAVVGVIGWQIGVGLNRQWRPTASDKTAGAIALAGSVALGLMVGYVRALDERPFGWGWALESLTAFAATVIVWRWITSDLKTIAVRASGYPRSLFWKGMFSNSLILGFWIHLILQEGGFTGLVLLRNNGLTFNVLVGNVLYFVYYGAYEYHRYRQRPAVAA